MKKIILALYILYLPFQLRIPSPPLINTVNLFLILLLLILIFGKKSKVLGANFEIPLVIFLCIWFISFFHTIFLYSWEIWKWEVFIEFKRLIALVLGYFVFSRCLTSQKELRFVRYIFMGTLVLVGLHTWRNGILAGSHFADFKRSSGPFGVDWKGSDIAGGFLATFTPFLFSFFLFTKKKIIKWCSLGGLIICILGIFTTYSRGSILALGIAFIITILCGIKYFIKHARWVLFMLIIIISVLVAKWELWVPQSIINRAENTVKEESINNSEATFDESTQGRINAWNAGMEIFKSSPLFGVGFRVPLYILSHDPHNTYIQILAEMGIFAIFVFAWFIFSVFMYAKTLLRTDFIAIGAGVIGCLSGFIIVNIFYSNFFRDTVVGSFWVLLGMLVASKRLVGMRA